MGRFLAIVLILVVVALAVNCFIDQGDDTTAAISEADVPQEGADAPAESAVPPVAETAPTESATTDAGEEEVELDSGELSTGVPDKGPPAAD